MIFTFAPEPIDEPFIEAAALAIAEDMRDHPRITLREAVAWHVARNREAWSTRRSHASVLHLYHCLVHLRAAA